MRTNAIGWMAVTLAWVLLVPGPSNAQDDLPAIRVTVEPDSVTVGDIITVVVTVEHTLATSVTWPDPFELPPFEILRVDHDEPTREDDRLVSRAVVTLTSFELGELAVPTLSVEVVAEDNANSPTSLSTSPLAIAVTSVGRDETSDIRDIRGPLFIPFQVVTLLPWIAGGLVLAGTAFWFYRRYARRPTAAPAAPPAPPPRPPEEVAYEALLAIELSDLLARGEVKTFHIRLSDTMRVYIEGRFDVQAMEMTTGEVLTGLRRTNTQSEIVGRFRRLLDRCDLVKFAKHRPEPTDCHDLVGLARGLVDVTTKTEAVSPESPAADTPQEHVA